VQGLFAFMNPLTFGGIGMCKNFVRFNGETVNCGTRITRFETDGKRKRETVLCYSCVKDAALRWSMADCEKYLMETFDTDYFIDLSMPKSLFA
jgi:hypothetical protein